MQLIRSDNLGRVIIFLCDCGEIISQATIRNWWNCPICKEVKIYKERKQINAIVDKK